VQSTGSGPARPDRDTYLASLRCSFCGKPGDTVESIICGPTPATAICSECIELVSEILSDQRGEAPGDHPPPAAA
jgi:hypothetical protein